MSDVLACHPAMRELERIILRLSLVSHAPVQSYEIAPGEPLPPRWRSSYTRAPVPHAGGRHHGQADSGTPTGGIDVRGDRTPEFRQKSHIYFERRLSRVRTGEQLEALLVEAREVLRDWMKTPSVDGVEPERGSFAWKCLVADDVRPVGVVCEFFGVSRRSVYRYRSMYRSARLSWGKVA